MDRFICLGFTKRYKMIDEDNNFHRLICVDNLSGDDPIIKIRYDIWKRLETLYNNSRNPLLEISLSEEAIQKLAKILVSPFVDMINSEPSPEYKKMRKEFMKKRSSQK